MCCMSVEDVNEWTAPEELPMLLSKTLEIRRSAVVLDHV